MKKSQSLFKVIFTVSVLTLLTLIISCEKSTDATGNEGVIENAELIVAESNKQIIFSGDSESKAITFTTNNNWTVESNAEWCVVSPSSGTSKYTSFTITVAKNTAGAENKAEITIRSAKLTEKISVTQLAAEQANYTDVDWTNTTISSYDESSGSLSITFTGNVPEIETNSVMILPENYDYAIRVITSHSVSGNTLTTTTEEGNMSNLFRNINFTLTTDPSLSSLSRSYASSSNIIITPSDISIMTPDGYEVIYESHDTKSESNKVFDIFSYNADLSGTDIYNESGERLFWDKCVFDIGMTGLFNFIFGEEVINSIPKGSLESFSFYLNGDVNVDMLLKYTAQYNSSINIQTLIKENVIPPLRFIFHVGAVPVPIIVHTDLHGKAEASADAEIAMSTGSNLRLNTQVGMSYVKGGGVTPIKSITPNFTIHQPIFAIKGSAVATASIYPNVRFGIYKFIGPWVELMPSSKGRVDGGMQIGGNNTYFGWTAGFNVGFDLKMGLDLDFIVWKGEIWKSEVYNMTDISILECPNKIELISPDKSLEVEPNVEIDVKFKVFNYSPILEEYFSSIGALIKFVSENGDVDKTFAASNMNGEISVKWIPQGAGSKLIAKIVDKDGKTLSEVIYSPKIKGDEPLVGVRVGNILVSDRNVGAQQGGVALNYTNVTGHPDYNNSSFKGAYYTWDEAMTICPSGWRLPTLEEMQLIAKAIQLSDGRAYLVGSDGSKCYFPLSGNFIEDSFGLSFPILEKGYYWSSTTTDKYSDRIHVYVMHVNNYLIQPGILAFKPFGLSVRCVKTVL